MAEQQITIEMKGNHCGEGLSFRLNPLVDERSKGYRIPCSAKYAHLFYLIHVDDWQ